MDVRPLKIWEFTGFDHPHMITMLDVRLLPFIAHLRGWLHGQIDDAPAQASIIQSPYFRSKIFEMGA